MEEASETETVKDFRTNVGQDDFPKMEEYPVQGLKLDIQLKTMNALRYYIYQRSKNVSHIITCPKTLIP